MERSTWHRCVVGGLAALLLTGAPPGGLWAAEEPQEQETPVIAVEPVEVSGKRIENVEDVKREFARRPGSNILIQEKEITEIARAESAGRACSSRQVCRFQSRFGADEGQFQIRGTSLRNNFHHRGINILINGIFFGDADGFSDFESIDLLAYERIEVYKGANALRYGANSIGGCDQLRAAYRLQRVDVADAYVGRQLRHGERAGLQRQSLAALQGGQHERHDGLLHQRVRQSPGRVSGQQSAGPRTHQCQHRGAARQSPGNSRLLSAGQCGRAASRLTHDSAVVFQPAASGWTEPGGHPAVLRL
jgi:outer membrane receptor protein involved in Fe transport